MRVKSDLETVRRTLIRAARAQKPDDAVPYAYERRITARLGPGVAPSAWLVWGQALWRAAAACVIFTALLSVWSFWPVSNDEPATLESTVFAEAEQTVDLW
jgi:hypothetical protein